MSCSPFVVRPSMIMPRPATSPSGSSRPYGSAQPPPKIGSTFPSSGGVYAPPKLLGVYASRPTTATGSFYLPRTMPQAPLMPKTVYSRDMMFIDVPAVSDLRASRPSTPRSPSSTIGAVVSPPRIKLPSPPKTGSPSRPGTSQSARGGGRSFAAVPTAPPPASAPALAPAATARALIAAVDAPAVTQRYSRAGVHVGVQANPPPPPPTAALWQSQVVPAITWLHAWSESTLSRVGLHPPSALIQREQEAALRDATEHVSLALVGTEELAAGVWRNLVGLLSHVMVQVEMVVAPLRASLEMLTKQYEDAVAEVTELRDALAFEVEQRTALTSSFSSALSLPRVGGDGLSAMDWQGMSETSNTSAGAPPKASDATSSGAGGSAGAPGKKSRRKPRTNTFSLSDPAHESDTAGIKDGDVRNSLEAVGAGVAAANSGGNGGSGSFANCAGAPPAAAAAMGSAIEQQDPAAAARSSSHRTSSGGSTYGGGATGASRKMSHKSVLFEQGGGGGERPAAPRPGGRPSLSGGSHSGDADTTERGRIAEAELAEARAHIVTLQRELSVAREAAASSPRASENSSTMDHLRAVGAVPDGDSDTTSDPSGSPAYQRRGSNGAPNSRGRSIEGLEDDLVGRLEQEVRFERAQRAFLTKLRRQLMHALGDGYVLSLEEQLRNGRSAEQLLADFDRAADEDEAEHAHDVLGGGGVFIAAERQVMPRERAGTDCGTQYDSLDAELAQRLHEAAREKAAALALRGEEPEDQDGESEDFDSFDDDDDDDDDEQPGGESPHDASTTQSLHARALVRFSAPSAHKQKQPPSARETVGLASLSLRQLGWTSNAIMEQLSHLHIIDELEHRQRGTLQSFVRSYFLQLHARRDVALRRQREFRKGIRAAAELGNRRALCFALLAGYMRMPGEAEKVYGTLATPSACHFVRELERIAMTAAGYSYGGAAIEGSTSAPESGAPVWLAIERALELLRAAFPHARASDAQRVAVDVEELLRMPDEVREIRATQQAAYAAGGLLPAARRDNDGGDKGVETRDPKTGLPLGYDAHVFRERPSDEQRRLLRRREAGLVQSKVLRAIARRGLSLAEVFNLLDTDGSEDIDTDEFVVGMRALDPTLSETQCARLMERLDADGNGALDYNELATALQHLDLKVDLDELLLVCMRYYHDEVHRSAGMLTQRFADMVAQRDERSKRSVLPGATPTLPSEKVKELLRTLNAPFAGTVLARVLTEMINMTAAAARAESQKAEQGKVDENGWPVAMAAQQPPAEPKKKKSGGIGAAAAALAVVEVDKDAPVNSDAFVRVCLAHGFHAVASPAFSEETPWNSKISSLRAAVTATTAVAKFSSKLRGKK